MDTPFFIGIGAQRASTSWMSQYLQAHPQVGFSPVKELHFFDVLHDPDTADHFNKRMIDELVRIASDLTLKPASWRAAKVRCLAMRVEMIPTPERYKDYFELLCERQHKIVGEITPAYSTLGRVAFADMLSYFPETRFLFMLRDPVDRFVSQVRYMGANTGLEEAMRPERVLENLADEKFVHRSDYKRTLTELGSVVDSDRVCVAFFEHLMSPATHRDELKRVTDFFGVDCVESSLDDRVNQGTDADISDTLERAIAARFSETYEYIASTFGDRMPERWRERMAMV